MEERVALGSGWDCDAVLVDGHRVERTARRAEVEPRLRTETRLLPWLAPRLPLPVPRPVVVAEAPLVVAHDLLPGEALTAPTAEHGTLLGAFLRALHATPLAGALAHGLPGPTSTRTRRAAAFDRFATEVLPRLSDPAPLRDRLARLREAPSDVVVHGDLGPGHVVSAGDGRLAGVIDWGDCRAGDPAKDLAWLLHDAGPVVAAATLDAYGDDGRALRGRAADWRAVAPCYAVTHGLDTGDAALVASALVSASRT